MEQILLCICMPIVWFLLKHGYKLIVLRMFKDKNSDIDFKKDRFIINGKDEKGDGK